MCFFAGGIKYAEQGFGVSECRSRFFSFLASAEGGDPSRVRRAMSIPRECRARSFSIFVRGQSAVPSAGRARDHPRAERGTIRVPSLPPTLYMHLHPAWRLPLLACRTGCCTRRAGRSRRSGWAPVTQAECCAPRELLSHLGAPVVPSWCAHCPILARLLFSFGMAGRPTTGHLPFRACVLWALSHPGV